MKKSTKITIGIVAALSAVAAAAIWWVYKNRKEVQAENAKIPTYYTKDIPYTDASYFPLKQGKQGASVKLLQQALNAIPPMIYARIDEDGVFGPKTETLLKNKLGVTEVSQELYKQLIKKSSK